MSLWDRFRHRSDGRPAKSPASGSPKHDRAKGVEADRRRSGRRSVTIISASCAGLVLLLLVFLGPGSFRVWSAQRNQTQELNEKITTLDQVNARLASRAEQLEKPAAIRELARRDYGMVRKGAKAYAILPLPAPDDRPGGTWPFVELKPKSDSR